MCGAWSGCPMSPWPNARWSLTSSPARRHPVGSARLTSTHCLTSSAASPASSLTPPRQRRRTSTGRSGSYPAMINTWEAAWGEFVPFLDYPVEPRTVVYTTNAGEPECSVPAAVRHRGHFPNEQAALKVLYLVATETKRTGPTRARGSTPGNPSSTHSPSTTATASRPPADHEAITPGYRTNRTVPRHCQVPVPARHFGSAT
jgi:hypothetical protein